jgi:hypothetical protein
MVAAVAYLNDKFVHFPKCWQCLIDYFYGLWWGYSNQVKKRLGWTEKSGFAENAAFTKKYLKSRSRALGNDLGSKLSMPTNDLAELMPFYASGRLEGRLTMEEGADSPDDKAVSWIQNFATENSSRSLKVWRDLLETKAGACEGAVSMAYGSVQQQVQDLERKHIKALIDRMTELIPMIVKDAIDQTANSTALATVKKQHILNKDRAAQLSCIAPKLNQYASEEFLF